MGPGRFDFDSTADASQCFPWLLPCRLDFVSTAVASRCSCLVLFGAAPASLPFAKSHEKLASSFVSDHQGTERAERSEAYASLILAKLPYQSPWFRARRSLFLGLRQIRGHVAGAEAQGRPRYRGFLLLVWVPCWYVFFFQASPSGLDGIFTDKSLCRIRCLPGILWGLSIVCSGAARRSLVRSSHSTS